MHLRSPGHTQLPGSQLRGTQLSHLGSLPDSQLDVAPTQLASQSQSQSQLPASQSLTASQAVTKKSAREAEKLAKQRARDDAKAQKEAEKARKKAEREAAKAEKAEAKAQSQAARAAESRARGAKASDEVTAVIDNTLAATKTGSKLLSEFDAEGKYKKAIEQGRLPGHTTITWRRTVPGANVRAWGSDLPCAVLE